ncbi:DUF1801 domain-containing protein [Pelagovum pacificum]|uniref:DUF1801 domain-containing protein n=2 Tax=Pelagovum pacificum TaxID=2588711 RepID=A0A5C5GJN2_9RHOB|nr:DUF1801 domain-containing protein [Pelagovum pacificum]
MATWPSAVRRRALDLRALTFDVAARTNGVGPLTETLKWGEPAYLTAATGSGTTLRIAPVRGDEAVCGLFVNCRTTLVDTFRERFGDSLDCRGDRLVAVPTTGAVPQEVGACIALTLTYFRWR